MIKTLMLIFSAMLILFIPESRAQTENSSPSKYDWLPQNSWSFGFGAALPRYVSTDLQITTPVGFGGYLSIQRNFSEHVGLRLGGTYVNMKGKTGLPLQTVTNNSFAGDFDLLYYLVPCEPVSPYLGVGVGGLYYSVSGSPVANNNDSFLDYEVNLDFGAEWYAGMNWKVKTELGYHTTGSNKFDGISGTANGGIFGGTTDSYMTFNLGLVYYFSKGPRSKLCDLYDGISQNIDYAKIEEIVKKYASKPTVVDYDKIEKIVKNATPSAIPQNWVLVGVNFDFNKASLRPESLPILYNAVQILLTNPVIKVEIQGYTDNIGSDKYNKKLSKERAEAVRNFLIGKGVNPNRLKAAGYGEADPITSNKTAQGRAMNRRIEFRVLAQ